MTTDLLLGSDGDLMIKNGDLVVRESDPQHAGLILVSHQGSWRQWPLVGVGLSSFLLEDLDFSELRHRMEVQVQYDEAILDDFQVQINDDSFVVKNLTVRYPDGS